MTNEERASLVTQEYRYTATHDEDVKGEFPQAIDLVVETNLDGAGASDYMASLFARTSGYAQTFTVPVEGVYALEDFAAQAPRFTLSFARHPSIKPETIFTVVGASIDYSAGRTTLTVRG